jgi:hypothetical protein
MIGTIAILLISLVVGRLLVCVVVPTPLVDGRDGAGDDGGGGEPADPDAARPPPTPHPGRPTLVTHPWICDGDCDGDDDDDDDDDDDSGQDCNNDDTVPVLDD